MARYIQLKKGDKDMDVLMSEFNKNPNAYSDYTIRAVSPSGGQYDILTTGIDAAQKKGWHIWQWDDGKKEDVPQQEVAQQSAPQQPQQNAPQQPQQNAPQQPQQNIQAQMPVGQPETEMEFEDGYDLGSGAAAGVNAVQMPEEQSFTPRKESYEATLGQVENTLKNVNQFGEQADRTINRQGLGVNGMSNPYHVGENPRVSQRTVYNEGTGDFEQSYTTQSGNEYNSRSEADREQNMMDEYDWREKNPLQAQLRDAYARYSELEGLQAENIKNGTWKDNPDMEYVANAMRKTEQEIRSLETVLGRRQLDDRENRRDDKDWRVWGFAGMGTAGPSPIQGEVTSQDVRALGYDGITALKNTAGNIQTWDLGVEEVQAGLLAERLKEKMDKGGMLTENEQRWLNSKMGSQIAAAIEDDEMPDTYRFAKIGGESIPFMLGFRLYGGVMDKIANTATRLGARFGMKVGSQVSKVAPKIAGNNRVSASIKGWFGRQGAEKSVIPLTMKYMGTTVGDALGALSMATTIQGLSTAADVMERHAGQLSIDDNGQYYFKDGQSLPKAIKNGVLSATIENYSERFGEHLPGLSKALSSIGLQRASNWVKNMGKNEFMKMSRDFAKSTGVHGYFGEVFEEELGIALNALLTGDNKWTDFVDGRQQMDIFGGMLFGIGINQGMAVGPYGAHKLAQMKEFRNLEKDMNRKASMAERWFRTHIDERTGKYVLGESDGRWDELRDMIDSSENEKLTDVMTAIAAREDLEVRSKTLALSYAGSVIRMRAFNLAQAVQAKYDEEDEPFEYRAEKVSAVAGDIKWKNAKGEPILDKKGNQMTSTVGQYSVLTYDKEGEIVGMRTFDNEEDADVYLTHQNDAITNNKTKELRELLYVKDDDGSIWNAIESENGNRAIERLDQILDKPLHKRSEEETEFVNKMHDSLKNHLMTSDEVYEEENASDGEGLADNVDVTNDEQVTQAGVAVNNRIKAAQDRWDELVSRKPELRDTVENLVNDGKSANEIANYLADENGGGFTEDEVGAFSEMINSQAMKDGFVSKLGDKIEDAVNDYSSKITFRGTINGQSQPLGIQFTDEQGGQLWLVGGNMTIKDGQYQSDGLVIFRDSNGDLVQRTSMDGLAYQGEAPVEGFANVYRTQLQQQATADINSTDAVGAQQAGQTPQQGQALQGQPQAGQQGQPQQPVQQPLQQPQGQAVAQGQQQVAQGQAQGQPIQQPAAQQGQPLQQPQTEGVAPIEPETPQEKRDKRGFLLDENNEPIYENETVDKTLSAFLDVYKDNNKVGKAVNVREEKARKAYEDLLANEPEPTGETSKDEKAITEWNANIEKAKKSSEYWKGVKDEHERRVKESAEKAEIAAAPDIVYDTPVDARNRGFRNVNGQRVDRQQPKEHVKGKEIGVKFSSKVTQQGNVGLMEASELQPSHIRGQRNVAFFLDEAQPKNRTDKASILSSQRIASEMRPEEITSSVTAYTGAPNVNTRGEVIQGNNRTDALITMWESYPEQAEKYRQYLKDHAEEFGLTADAIDQMKQPVLVNIFDMEDEKAIELGQYTAADTESGGIERIKAKNTIQKMGEDMKSFANILLSSADEEASFSQLLDSNGRKLLDWMAGKGYVTDTQFASALDSNGNLTAEAKNDMKGIMYQSIFTGGNQMLEEKFNTMPAKAQKAILATAYRDYDSPESERMIDEIQASVNAFYELMQDKEFASATKYEDARKKMLNWTRQVQLDMATGESVLPSEKYSNFALLMAAAYKGRNQKSIQDIFDRLFDLIQGTQKSSLFEEPDNTPRTLEQAIKETLNIDYNGKKRSVDVAGNNPAEQGGEPNGEGNAGGREQNTGGEPPANGGRGAGENVGEKKDRPSDGHRPREERVKDADPNVFPSEYNLYGKHSMLYDYQNGVSVYVDENGEPSIYLGANESGDTYVGVFRDSTGRWSSKMENGSHDKSRFKEIISAVMNAMPEGAQYYKHTNVSADGLRVFAQQLKHGFALGKETYETGLNGADVNNVLGEKFRDNGDFESIRCTAEELEQIKEILKPHLEALGRSVNDVRRDASGKVLITLPVLVKQAESVSDAESLLSSMKAHASAIPFVEVTDANWRESVETPIGTVKMGENQREKLLTKGREQQYGMMLETLSNPDIILEERDNVEDVSHERSSSRLYVKTFTKEDGSKYVHFESVSVSQEGMEVSISSHIIRENQLLNKMKSDRLLYRATALDESANSSAEQPVTEGGSPSSGAKIGNKSESDNSGGVKNTETAQGQERVSNNIFDEMEKNPLSRDEINNSDFEQDEKELALDYLDGDTSLGAQSAYAGIWATVRGVSDEETKPKKEPAAEEESQETQSRGLPKPTEEESSDDIAERFDNPSVGDVKNTETAQESKQEPKQESKQEPKQEPRPLNKREQIDKDEADAISELRDLVDKFKKAHDEKDDPGTLMSTLIPKPRYAMQKYVLTNAQLKMLPKLVGVMAKVAYAKIRKGVYDIGTIVSDMKEQLKDVFSGLDEAFVDDLYKDLPNTKVTDGNERKSIAQWIEHYKNAAEDDAKTANKANDNKGNNSINTEETPQNKEEDANRGRQDSVGAGSPVGEKEQQETGGAKPRRVDRRNGGNKESDQNGSGGISGLANKSERLGLNSRNNHGERGVDYAPKSPQARYKANIAAIKTLMEVEESGQPATAEQKGILRKFSGWGGLGSYFNKESKEYDELKSLLDDTALEAAELSRNSAYYTPAKIIDTLWDIAERLGFKGGNILEGSAGIGNILGQMPLDISGNSSIQAVEVDDITGRILKQLYPDAQVNISGFEQTDVKAGSVDLAITNVPFVDGLSVYDKKNPDLSERFGKKNICDFCIAKNIRALRPGGIGIFITSSTTMDSSSALRKWIITEANTDVIGAFRLHNETFGGTTATSDIIVVRKRIGNEQSPNAIDVQGTVVTRTAERETGEMKKGEPVKKKLFMTINGYYAEHPDNLGGEMQFGFEKDGRYPDSQSMYPEDGVSQDELLEDWVKTFAEELKPQVERESEEDKQYEKTDARTGEVVVDKDGEVCQAYKGRAIPLGVNKNKVRGYQKSECVNDYNNLRNAINEVVEYESGNNDDKGLKPLLSKLNKAYDTFVAKYGSLNKNTAISFLRYDVDFPSIAAVENYKEKVELDGQKTIETSKTDIFNGRIIGKEAEPKPENVREGVIVSIYKNGKIDIPYIAEKLGKSEEDTREEILKERLGFVDPQTGEIEVRYNYLSGNVREKLKIAESNNENGSMSANIEELRKVIPMDIPAHLIEMSLGATWITPDMFRDFIIDQTGADISCNHVGGLWVFNEKSGLENARDRMQGVYSSQLNVTIYGHELIEAAMNNQTVKVQKQETRWRGDIKETVTVTDKEATQACTNRIAEIKDAFKDWARTRVQQDEALGEKLASIYNDKFNAYQPKRIDGIFLPEQFGGANKNIRLYPHQRKAVVRGTTENLMLAHEVGTGKTFTLISTAMEMRRLGTAKKPCIVVQNATVNQFVADAKKLYPSAKILTVQSNEHNPAGRKRFYSKIKYNDWDLIVIPQSVLNMIPDSDRRRTAYIQEKVEEKQHIIDMMEAAGADKRVLARAKKELEDMQEAGATGDIGAVTSGKKKDKKKDEKKAAVARQNAKARAEKALDRRVDDVKDWDDLGIDALLVDEAHNYKRLGFATSIQGVKGIDTKGSTYSVGLYLKAQSVMERTSGRNVIFATGTPISNTAAEVWTFMKYLLPKQMMEENDMYYFDDFVHNFGGIQQMVEFATNGKFKENTRFAKYIGVPELVRLWSTCSDTVLSRDAETSDGGKLSDRLPEIEGGKPQDIFLPQTKGLRRIMKFVKQRLEDFEHMDGKEKRENSSIPLVMFGIAQRAAIDPRLVDSTAEDEPNSKVNRAVEEILKDVESTNDYNGTVAVFCDSYKGPGGFNLFDDMKKKLVAGGIPEDKVAVIEGDMTVAKKQKIFDKVKTGEIRVVLGTTSSMGTGVNIQDRLHLLVHMDAPARPMDYDQRNGRIRRQGNFHKEWGKTIRILRFGVEDSLDVTAYQRLKTKKSFIDAIMEAGSQYTKGENINNQTDRTIEEEDEGEFDNPVAMLSGSEYALLKNKAERDLRKYQNLKTQYRQDQIYIESKMRQHSSTKERATESIEQEKKLLAKVEELFPTGKANVTTINNVECRSLEDVEKQLTEVNKKVKEFSDKMKANNSQDVGRMMIPITFDGVEVKGLITITRKLEKEGTGVKTVMQREIGYICPALGITEARKVGGGYLRGVIEEFSSEIVTGEEMRENISGWEETLNRIERETVMFKERFGKPFEFDKELEEARARVVDYTEKMREELKAKEEKYKDEEIDGDFDLDKAVDDAFDEEENENDDEALFRIGEGEVSDDTMSIEHDPISRWTGELRGTAEERAAFAARERERMSAHVSELAEGMNLDNVELTTDSEGLSEEQKTAKGWFDPKTGKISIVLGNHVDIEDIEKTLLHEAVAHYGLRRLFGAQFGTFLDNVFNNVDLETQRKIVDIMESRGVSRRVATEEYIASLAEDTNFEDSHMQSWWWKIKKAFIDMLHKIGFKGYWEDITDNELRYILWRSYQNLSNPGRYGSILGEPVTEWEATESSDLGLLFRDKDGYTEEEHDIIEAAKANGTYMKAPNGKDSNLSPRQWVQVRTKAFKEWFGDWEKAIRIGKLRRSKSIIITGKEIAASDDLKEYKKNALEYGKKLRGEYTNKDTGEVISLTGGNNRGGLREILQHDYKDVEHLQSIAAIPQIIEESIFIDELENEDATRHPGVKSFSYYVCGLKIGGVDYTVKAVIANQTNGERYYDHKLTNIEKGKLLSIVPTIQKAGMENNSPLSGYKDKRLISILQTNSSKVVDENGEPLIVYHGTPNADFNLFDNSKKQSGSYPVDGFMFSSSSRIADGYSISQVLTKTDNINGTPLNPDNEELVVERDENILKYNGKVRYGVKSRGEWVPNAFADTEEEAMAKARRVISTKYFRKENSGVKAVFLNVRNPLDVEVQFWRSLPLYIARAKEKGFDGVIARNIEDSSMFLRSEIADDYVVFAPNQIKSATDNEGTFSAESNDIRYRRGDAASVSRESAERKKAAINEMLGRINSEAVVHESINDVPSDVRGRIERGRRITGWYDTKSGEVHLYLPNIRDAYDAERTIVHEIVGHKGMRGLLGERGYRMLMDRIYDAMNESQKAEIRDRMMRNGWNYYTAMDEWISEQAEQTVWDRNSMSLWQKIRQAIVDAIREIGYRVMPNLNDVKYWVWLSKNRLREGDVYNEVRRQALLNKLEKSVPKAVSKSGQFGYQTAECLMRSFS